MRWILLPILGAALVAATAPGAAMPSSPNTTDEEIRHLLDAVERSQCTFIRNEREYPAVEARAHIEMKYNHVRRRVASAEDFIELAASKSSITGRPYFVDCRNEPRQKARDWLLRRLRELRDGST